MIKPHESFAILSPDTVAECWDGVYRNEMVPDLYEQLWNLTKRYDESYKANIEDMGPHDVIGINSVGTFWSSLPEATQLELNRLAELNTH